MNAKVFLTVTSKFFSVLFLSLLLYLLFTNASHAFSGGCTIVHIKNRKCGTVNSVL